MTQLSAFLLNIGGQMRPGLAGVWQVLAGISWPVFLQRAMGNLEKAGCILRAVAVRFHR